MSKKPPNDEHLPLEEVPCENCDSEWSVENMGLCPICMGQMLLSNAVNGVS